LELVPAGVKKIYLRSDSAAYFVELLKYCAEGKNEGFVVIEFAVGIDMSESFRQAVRKVAETGWHRLFRVVDGTLEETG